MLICKKIMLPALCFMMMHGNAIAEEKTPIVASFEAQTELLSDSSVGLSEIDQNTEQSDNAWQVTLSPSVEIKPNDIFSFTASYDWSRKEYFEQEQFNLDLGSVHLDGAAKVKGFTVGSRYDRSDATLSDEDFLTLTQRSVYLARLINNRWYWRVSGIEKDKSFPGREDRNAENTGGRIDLFAFLNNMQVIWAMGLASENEEANDALFDFRGLAANVSLTRKFQLFDRKSEIKFAYRFRENDYTGYDASIAATRLDRNHQASVGMKVQALEKLAFIAEVIKRDQASNFPSAEYDEVVASAGLSLAF